MYGFYPPGVESSFKTYFFYSLIPLEVNIDSKTNQPVKATSEYLASTFSAFLVGFVKMSILLSTLVPYDYSPFNAPSTFTLSNAFHPGRLANNMVGAVLFQQCLSTFAPGIALMSVVLTGFQLLDLMKNPMFTATSPVSFNESRLLISQI